MTELTPDAWFEESGLSSDAEPKFITEYENKRRPYDGHVSDVVLEVYYSDQTGYFLKVKHRFYKQVQKRLVKNAWWCRFYRLTWYNAEELSKLPAIYMSDYHAKPKPTRKYSVVTATLFNVLIAGDFTPDGTYNFKSVFATEASGKPSSIDVTYFGRYPDYLYLVRYQVWNDDGTVSDPVLVYTTAKVGLDIVSDLLAPMFPTTKFFK